MFSHIHTYTTTSTFTSIHPVALRPVNVRNTITVVCFEPHTSTISALQESISAVRCCLALFFTRLAVLITSIDGRVLTNWLTISWLLTLCEMWHVTVSPCYMWQCQRVKCDMWQCHRVTCDMWQCQRVKCDTWQCHHVTCDSVNV